MYDATYLVGYTRYTIVVKRRVVSNIVVFCILLLSATGRGVYLLCVFVYNVAINIVIQSYTAYTPQHGGIPGVHVDARC